MILLCVDWPAAGCSRAARAPRRAFRRVGVVLFVVVACFAALRVRAARGPLRCRLAFRCVVRIGVLAAARPLSWCPLRGVCVCRASPSDGSSSRCSSLSGAAPRAGGVPSACWFTGGCRLRRAVSWSLSWSLLVSLFVVFLCWGRCPLADCCSAASLFVYRGLRPGRVDSSVRTRCGGVCACGGPLRGQNVHDLAHWMDGMRSAQEADTAERMAPASERPQQTTIRNNPSTRPATITDNATANSPRRRHHPPTQTSKLRQHPPRPQAKPRHRTNTHQQPSPRWHPLPAAGVLRARRRRHPRSETPPTGPPPTTQVNIRQGAATSAAQPHTEEVEAPSHWPVQGTPERLRMEVRHVRRRTRDFEARSGRRRPDPGLGSSRDFYSGNEAGRSPKTH